MHLGVPYIIVRLSVSRRNSYHDHPHTQGRVLVPTVLSSVCTAKAGGVSCALENVNICVEHVCYYLRAVGTHST